VYKNNLKIKKLILNKKNYKNIFQDLKPTILAGFYMYNRFKFLFMSFSCKEAGILL
jgi:hypothetical protein